MAIGNRTPAPIGQRFGYWLVIGEPNRTERVRRFLCRCNCGVEREVLLGSLHSGVSLSCGCLRKKEFLQHADIDPQTRSHVLGILNGVRQRCYNPSTAHFHRYGGRGIFVCQEWLDDPVAFLRDMGPSYVPGLTLDRKDNDGPYSRQNCRWATMQEQAMNRPNTAVVETALGPMSIARIASVAGIHRDTVSKRINAGITGEALFAPSRYKPRQKRDQ